MYCIPLIQKQKKEIPINIQVIKNMPSSDEEPKIMINKTYKENLVFYN